MNRNDLRFLLKHNKVVGDPLYVRDSYASIKRHNDYLYEVSYQTHNYKFATDWLNSHFPFVGGCSSLATPNFLARNFDWNYDEQVDFVVRTEHSQGNLASLALCSNVLNLNKQVVDSRAYSDAYKLLPFYTVDGINEAGVAVTINIIGIPELGFTTGTNPGRPDLNMGLIPRLVLDQFTTAEEAAHAICDDYNVYSSIMHGDKHEIHIIIADSSHRYILEFQNNICFLTEDPEYPFMTNFYVKGTQVQNSQVVNASVTPYGQGLERYNLILGAYDEDMTKQQIVSLLQSLYYTNAYKTTTSPRWNTEFTGDFTKEGFGNLIVTAPSSAFDGICQYASNLYNNRVRDGKTWQTVHSSIYDLSSKSLTLYTQEGQTPIEFNF